MSKRRKKQNVKKNLLERDDYRCGIHLGGCGKILTLEETTEDHIIPQNILKNTLKIKEIKDSYKRQTRQSLDEGLFNLQPMCLDCNSVKKQGNFPPQNIIKKCSNKCCKFIYVYDKKVCSLAFTYYFPKKSKSSMYSKSQCIFIVFPFKRYQLMKEKNSLLLFPDVYIVSGVTKNRKIGFSFNQYGGNVSIIDMIKNNKKYTKEELIDSGTKYLLKYPKRKFQQSVEKLINFEESVTHYDNLIAENQKDVEAYFHQGEIKYELGKYNEALIDYSKAVKLNPKHIKALYKQGACYSNLGKFEKAKSTYYKIIEIQPNHIGAYFDLALVSIDCGEYNVAINYLNKIIRLKPNNSTFYNYLGIAQFKIGKPREAIESFDKALTLDPNNKTAQHNKKLVQNHLELNRNCLTKA